METIIADHNEMYVQDIDLTSSETETSIYDIAALLSYCGNKTRVNLFGNEYALQTPKTKTKLEKVGMVGEWRAIKKELKSKGWVSYAQTFLKNIESSDDKKRAGVLIFSLSKTSLFSTSFSLAFSKRDDGKYSMYSSCSPLKLMTGQNVKPIKLSSVAAVKADEILKLHMLPLYCVCLSMFRRIKDPLSSTLYQNHAEGRVYFTRIQMAAYTEPFNTKHEMLSSLITLKTVYETPVSKFEGSSLKNYGVANYLQGRVISNNESSGDACDETAKGFAFTRKYSNKSMFTLGFYDKAGWEGEDLGVLNNAIRLDLTLFKAAFVPLSKGMGFMLPPDFKMSSGDLKIFFEKVFDLDITGGVLFSTVLVNWMKIEDLFLVKKQQWETCFELLKEKRQYGFLSVLQEGKAFTTAVQENTLNAKTNAPFDDKAFATRLSNLCSTDIVKFDPTFNYPVWRAARNTLYRMFIDEEELLSWFEETPSNYSPKNQSKIGRLAAKSIAEKMRHGKLMTIDSVLDISGKAGKVQTTFDEVPF